MSTVEFEGQLCYEKPLPEGTHWVCNHLKKLLDSGVLGQSLGIRRILVGGNKSAEVFLFASEHVDVASLPDSVVAAPLARDGDRIGCNSCWTTLICEGQ